MFATGEFVIGKNQRQPNCLPASEVINKLLCLHIMGCQTIMKMNLLLLHATPWENQKKEGTTLWFHWYRTEKHSQHYFGTKDVRKPQVSLPDEHRNRNPSPNTSKLTGSFVLLGYGFTLKRKDGSAHASQCGTPYQHQTIATVEAEKAFDDIQHLFKILSTNLIQNSRCTNHSTSTL